MRKGFRNVFTALFLLFMKSLVEQISRKLLPKLIIKYINIKNDETSSCILRIKIILFKCDNSSQSPGKPWVSGCAEHVIFRVHLHDVLELQKFIKRPLSLQKNSSIK